MPYKPKKPCGYPGCPELTDGRYCAKHKTVAGREYNIRHDNTLRRSASEYTITDKVDAIVTNPPFGGAEEKAISNSVSAELRNTETADLFLVHIMALLKDGGRCGLVLPDGFLFGTGVKSSIKKKLLEENDLHTIVRLPKSVFAPYTSINTNLLFFTKGKPTKGVWFYRLEMPAGYKHFSKTKSMLDTHFDPVRKWWDNRVESEVSQYVVVDDIIAGDYNLDLCGFPHDIVDIPSPCELIQQYQKKRINLNADIDRILVEIESILGDEKPLSQIGSLNATITELSELNTIFPDLLKKSILQAAVQGKLVPQDPNDEPATELLKQIQLRKKQLIHDGKIKKDMQLPPISEEEILYDLPDGWGWCRLSDIGEIVGGATPLTTEPSHYTESGAGIAWITPADMKNATDNYISHGNKDITPKGYDSCSTKLLPKGSIVFSSRAPIGLIAFAKNDLCTNQGFKSIVPYDLSLNHWIFYALMDKTKNIISRASGTTFLEVSGEFMRKVIIALPPLAEQKRIITKIEEIMTLCNESKTAKDFQKATAALKTISFPQKVAHVEDNLEIGMAARGDGTGGLSEQAMHDADELFGVGSNA